MRDPAVVVAGVVIHTREGRAADVAARLAGRPDLTIHGGDGSRRLAAVWTAPDGASLERLGEALLQEDTDILGIFPTFVGTDPEEPA